MTPDRSLLAARSRALVCVLAGLALLGALVSGCSGERSGSSSGGPGSGGSGLASSGTSGAPAPRLIDADADA
ncbi:UNVERIFIED_CONTAM: hypothetical protein ODW78_00780, partial [Salmonella enterica subsp. enterica serovar Enteritidis]